MKLKGKTAVVTGAGSGIGRAIARRFAAEGAAVALVDLNGGAVQAEAQALRDEGRVALGLWADVSDEGQVDTAFDEAAARLGGVDVLVSNAGVQHIAPIVELTFADWRRVLAVHLDGAFLTTRAAVRHMVRQGRGGAVLYTGSVHSVEASPLKAPYVAAKHGLIGLARAVAKEGAAHGIRANVFGPGFVRTPLVDRQIPEQAEALGLTEEQVVKTVMLRNTVDGEFTALDDVAETALFLAAFPTLALTGQSLLVSHGWHMQ